MTRKAINQRGRDFVALSRSDAVPQSRSSLEHLLHRLHCTIVDLPSLAVQACYAFCAVAIDIPGRSSRLAQFAFPYPPNSPFCLHPIQKHFITSIFQSLPAACLHILPQPHSPSATATVSSSSIMFISRTKSQRESFSYRAGKATSKKQRSFKDINRASRLSQQLPQSSSPTTTSPTSPNLNSPIVTISVGQSQRLFAAHEEVLKRSPFFAQACKAQFFETAGKRIELLTEEPEVFSAVLEFLYKGDYSPRLLFDKKGGGWTLEADGSDTPKVITYQRTAVSITVLKDTAIYCSAHRYGMPELQRVALKKQGLQSNVSCSTILSSARFAYANTPPSDSKLRAHYLALIIRSRNIFKRSGTMQAEMKVGGTDLFFDLFVALVNHLDDVATATKSTR